MAQANQCSECYWLWIPMARSMEWIDFVNRCVVGTLHDAEFAACVQAAREYHRNLMKADPTRKFWFRDFWMQAVKSTIRLGVEL